MIEWLIALRLADLKFKTIITTHAKIKAVTLTIDVDIW